MMLGVGKAAEADPCAIPAGSDGLQAGMSFDVSGRRSIDPEELVQLLRHRFFNVLLVDVTTESSEPQLVLKHMDPPAPGTVSKLQPQEPSAFIASTMDKSRDLAPIVGSRRFASLVKIRNLVRYVSSAQLAEYERRKASLESKGNQDTLDGDATAVDLETGRGINGVDGSSSPSSRQKKRDSGVDLRDQSESGAEDSDASDCDDDDMEPMDVGGRLEELDDCAYLEHWRFRHSQLTVLLVSFLHCLCLSLSCSDRSQEQN